MGIDLSANPARTGACSIDGEAASISFLPHADDQELVAAAVAADMTAIDVPLGWPDRFVDAIVAHRELRGWPPAVAASAEQLDAARREGWIHLPTVGLAEVIDATG